MISATVPSKVSATRTNWNVRLSLKGYKPSTVFERSPVLGTKNVRVRPLNTKAWMDDYLSQHPDVLTGFCAENGLVIADDEKSEMIEVLRDDLFAVVCGRLDGVMGYASADTAPSVSGGLSFRVGKGEQIESSLTSGGSKTALPTAPASKSDLAAKIAAQRARILEVRKNAEVKDESEDGVPTGPSGHAAKNGKKSK